MEGREEMDLKFGDIAADAIEKYVLEKSNE